MQAMQVLRENKDDLDLYEQVVNEREQEIYKIEGKVIDIKEIMSDLAILTDIQGEDIDHIEKSIELAKENTDEGVVQLEKANKNLKKRSCCIIV